MLGIKDFKRLIKPIQKKIFMMVGRAILLAVNNSGKYQLIKISATAGEILDKVERMQEYGLDSYPAVSSSSEVLCLAPNGNRDAMIAIKVQDREKRPTDLVEGEVALYTNEDSGGSHRIHLKAGQAIDINGVTITINGTNVTIDGNTVEILGAGVVATGVVTQECICSFTGAPHPDFSATVKASR